MSSSRKIEGPKVDGQWAHVAEFLENPATRDQVSEPAAQRLLEMHHQLDGFDLPDHVVKLAAQRLGIDPAEAKARFEKESTPNPLDADNFRQLGKMLVDDIIGAVQSLPMGPVRAFQDILKESKAVLDQSRQPHLTKAEKKELRAHFDKLHGELRKEMQGVQTSLSKDEQARTKLLSDPTGQPIKPEDLDARGQIELRKLDSRIDQHKSALNELGNVGMAFTTLRGESFWEQNWLVLNGGFDINAFAPVASLGAGGVREISVRDPRTGKAEVKDSVSAIGLVTNGFARKVVSVDDLKKGNWRELFSTKGSGAGFSPIPFLNVIRDPIVGDVIGVFIPGLLFAELNSRPDGKAGFGGGFVFGIPGLPAGPIASASWNHPIFRPLMSRTIAPLSQFFGYMIRSFQLGVQAPVSQAADWVKSRFKKGDDGTPPPSAPGASTQSLTT